MKQKELQLAGDLLKMREVLEKEHIKIDTMKEELNKPQWRKVAGEILSTQMEKKVEDLIKKSNDIQIGQWELGDIGSYRIKNI